MAAGPLPSRRDVLRSLAAVAGAAALEPLVAGCAARRPPPPKADARVDASFARLVLRVLAGDRGAEALLRDHPALTAVVRHQHATGSPSATRDGVLAEMLAATRTAGATPAVLDAWAGHDRELVARAEAAAAYLPPGWRFAGTIYLEMGYDIGIASPPDIVLNAGHRHIVGTPRELGFYATHEAHHVGFYGTRPLPAFERLADPARLVGIIGYLTQLEGMAVHAAWPARAAEGALGDDGDYRLYADDGERSRLAPRYAEMLERAERSRSEADAWSLVETMSASRLWYRFGALVAWTFEQRHGREALVATIADPAPFFSTAAELLLAAGAEPPAGW